MGKLACSSTTPLQPHHLKPLTLPLLSKRHEQAAILQATHMAAAVQGRMAHTRPAVLGGVVQPERVRQPAVVVLAAHNKRGIWRVESAGQRCKESEEIQTC